MSDDGRWLVLGAAAVLATGAAAGSRMRVGPALATRPGVAVVRGETVADGRRRVGVEVRGVFRQGSPRRTPRGIRGPWIVMGASDWEPHLRAVMDFHRMLQWPKEPVALVVRVDRGLALDRIASPDLALLTALLVLGGLRAPPEGTIFRGQVAESGGRLEAVPTAAVPTAARATFDTFAMVEVPGRVHHVVFLQDLVTLAAHGWPEESVVDHDDEEYGT